MDDSEDLQKNISENSMETDEGHLINENSNGLSHLLTESEFNNVDTGVDESSTSNQGFLNAVELSEGSGGDYLDNNSGFNNDNFDVGDNAITFPNEHLHAGLSDGDSHDILESGNKSASLEIDEMESDINEHTRESSEPPVNEFSSPPDLTSDTDMPLIENDSPTKELLCSDNTNSLIENDVTESSSQMEENKVEINYDKNSDRNKNVIESEPDDNVAKARGAEETEVVSEDELPTVEKPEVKDAENVSDDELPGPKPAELPADTEVVSDDELPSSKKDTKDSRKRKNEDIDKTDETSSEPAATSDSESSIKKQAVAKNGESKPIPAEKRLSTEEKPKKKLPELDRYWKVVNDDATDFTGWTYLLQYVDQESDVEAAREAYDAFLSHYPYCYGYWRKYADYEKRKGSKKKCNEVLERGLKAIPLSVDLWIHFLNHVKTTKADEHAYIRSQFEKAIDTCGLEFRSDRLWESYIKWEAENGSALNVTNIYDRLLTTPTLGYTSHFDNFQEHVMSEPVNGTVSQEELVRLRAEVREGTTQPQLDLPPGEDEPDDHIASDEESQAIKERIIAARRKIHKTTGEQVAARWTFEEGIKRPYFHVKPLERCQLKNWKAYLEWEKQHGSFKRAYVLHERCLIACALYEEFWLRLVKFLEERVESDSSLIAIEREVLERACTVHHLDKPELHLYWAHFEEVQGNPAKAAEILERIEKACPNYVQIQYRRVNLERRRGDYDKCSALYEQYITSAKNKAISSALAIKYARFLFHVRKDAEGARKVLDEAITNEPLNPRLHLQRLDMAIHTPDTPFEVLDELVQSYGLQPGAEAEAESCAAFAWRRRELAEERGSAVAAVAAARQLRSLQRALRKRARRDKADAPPPAQAVEPTKKKESNNATSSTNASLQTPYYPPASAAQYEQYPQAPYGNWGYSQPSGPYQHHPHSWPQYTNYY